MPGAAGMRVAGVQHRRHVHPRRPVERPQRIAAGRHAGMAEARRRRRRGDARRRSRPAAGRAVPPPSWPQARHALPRTCRRCAVVGLADGDGAHQAGAVVPIAGGELHRQLIDRAPDGGSRWRCARAGRGRPIQARDRMAADHRHRPGSARRPPQRCRPRMRRASPPPASPRATGPQARPPGARRRSRPET